MKLRQDGRTLYIQSGDKPSDSDKLVGLVDTPAIAVQIVKADEEKEHLRDQLASSRKTGEERSAEINRLGDANKQLRMQLAQKDDKESDNQRLLEANSDLQGRLDSIAIDLRNVIERMERGPCQDVNAKFALELKRIAANTSREVLSS